MKPGVSPEEMDEKKQSNSSQSKLQTSASSKQPQSPDSSTLSLPFSRSASSNRHHHRRLISAFRSLLTFLPLPIVCRSLQIPRRSPSELLNPSLGNRITGTLFGNRKGHIHFAVQEDPKSPPVLLLELTVPTSSLVKEMASGLVRIALECERTLHRGKLFLEPVWTMYCNGRKSGYALRRVSSDSDLHILRLVQAVSMGAGVLPLEEEGPEGELMYMRARFERVVGSKDSEAFYMMNPDGTGGPELSIFLLRI